MSAIAALQRALTTGRTQPRENVWVRPKGSPEWYRGRIMKVQPPSRESKVRSSRATSSRTCRARKLTVVLLAPQKRGPLYLVVFRRQFTNMRNNFAPREGTIRPDTPRVRALIFNAGA